jgi:hypothetical protein
MRTVTVGAFCHGLVTETGNFAVKGLAIGIQFLCVTTPAFPDERELPLRISGVRYLVLQMAVKTDRRGGVLLLQERFAMDAAPVVFVGLRMTTGTELRYVRAVRSGTFAGRGKDRMGAVAGLTGRCAGLPQSERGPVNTELILQRLFPGSVLAAEEMTTAAVHPEDLSVRDHGDVHMAFRTDEAFVDGSLQVIFYIFLMA